MHTTALGHHPQCYSGTQRCLCASSQPYRLPPERYSSTVLIPEPPLSYRLGPRQINIIYSSRATPWTKEELEESFVPRASSLEARHMFLSPSRASSPPQAMCSTYRLTPEQIKLIHSSQYSPALREQVRKSMVSQRATSQTLNSSAASAVQHDSYSRASQPSVQQQLQHSQYYRYTSSAQTPRSGALGPYHSSTMYPSSYSPSYSSSSGYSSGSSSYTNHSLIRGTQVVAGSGYTSNILVTEENDEEEDSDSEDSESYTQVY